MSENILTRDQRLAKLKMQVTSWSKEDLILQAEFAIDEIKVTPSDRHRKEMQDNLSIFAAEMERREIRLPAHSDAE